MLYVSHLQVLCWTQLRQAQLEAMALPVATVPLVAPMVAQGLQVQFQEAMDMAPLALVWEAALAPLLLASLLADTTLALAPLVPMPSLVPAPVMAALGLPPVQVLPTLLSRLVSLKHTHLAAQCFTATELAPPGMALTLTPVDSMMPPEMQPPPSAVCLAPPEALAVGVSLEALAVAPVERLAVMLVPLEAVLVLLAASDMALPPVHQQGPGLVVPAEAQAMDPAIFLLCRPEATRVMSSTPISIALRRRSCWTAPR